MCFIGKSETDRGTSHFLAKCWALIGKIAVTFCLGRCPVSGKCWDREFCRSMGHDLACFGRVGDVSMTCLR
jgi:hypothetical protein